ncbi:unnamed protein product [Gordionus sp. m RMFG-2023]|uniref:gem-associated protein 6-like n=1 Tax=Gordionus sp. m RMFG-2023 TaxID=3053472 RepID=UPI0030E541E0
MSNFYEEILGIDPLKLNSYVHKEVFIILKNETKYNGKIYTIDPVSESVIAVDDQDKSQTKIYCFPGHAVASIEIKRELTSHEIKELELIFEPSLATNYSESEIDDRRTQVETFLKSRMIPVSFIGSHCETFSLFDGILLIQPPYDIDNCQSENLIVLKQIQRMMKELKL